VEELKDEADVLASQPGELGVNERRQRGPVDPHLARARPVETGEEMHQRRLARARGTHDRGQLALRHGHGDAAQRGDGRGAFAVAAAEVARGEPHRRRRAVGRLVRVEASLWECCRHWMGPRDRGRNGRRTVPSRARKVVGRNSEPPSSPGRIRGASGRRAGGARSSPGRSEIGAGVDAPGRPSLYGGSMWPRAVPQRYAVEALALTLALAGQIELWARPDAPPSALAVTAALVATVPLLLRRRLPFAAPALAFAGLAVISLARPSAVLGGASFTLFALMLAFWAAGAQRDRQQAAAAAALGLAAVAVMIASGGHGGVVRTGDLELSLFIWS